MLVSSVFYIIDQCGKSNSIVSVMSRFSTATFRNTVVSLEGSSFFGNVNELALAL